MLSEIRQTQEGKTCSPSYIETIKMLTQKIVVTRDWGPWGRRKMTEYDKYRL